MNQTEGVAGVQRAIPIGTVATESIRVLGVVPSRSRTLVVSSITVFLAVAIAPSNSNYWSFDLGLYTTGNNFEARASVANPFLGIPAGMSVYELQKSVSYKVGEVVALRVRPFGSPAALAGCDVVFGIKEP